MGIYKYSKDEKLTNMTSKEAYIITRLCIHKQKVKSVIETNCKTISFSTALDVLLGKRSKYATKCVLHAYVRQYEPEVYY